MHPRHRSEVWDGPHMHLASLAGTRSGITLWNFPPLCLSGGGRMGKVPAPGDMPAVDIAPESLCLAGQASGRLPVQASLSPLRPSLREQSRWVLCGGGGWVRGCGLCTVLCRPCPLPPAGRFCFSASRRSGPWRPRFMGGKTQSVWLRAHVGDSRSSWSFPPRLASATHRPPGCT